MSCSHTNITSITDDFIYFQDSTDAASFKISNDNSNEPPKLPFTREIRKCPPMKTFKSDKVSSFKLSKSASTNFSSPWAKKTFARSVSADDQTQESARRGLRVLLPSLDQGIESFFPKSVGSNDSIDLTDFDEIDVSTEKLSQKKVTRGPKRRRPANAMRVLAHLRTDKIEEYTETVPDSPSPKNEPKDIKKSKFAAEAVAGLASVEDFSNISLKSVAEPMNITNLPYKTDAPMLVHIKGRRHVQCRLVPPKFSNLNNGDCFVLVTSDKLFSFIGKFANVIETKVCQDFCTSILRDKGMGCTATMLRSINERNIDDGFGKLFCKMLDRKDGEQLINAGHSEEDELIESCLQETNMVYEFLHDELVPMEDFWGQPLNISMIDSKKIFVFDFGSELYVWNGKNTYPDEKKVAMMLAEELFNEKFSYDMCHLNPIDFSVMCGHRDVKADVKMTGFKRPEFSILGRVNQNMETILFKQKFYDWPDIKINMKSDIPFVDCNDIEQIDGAALFRNWMYEEPNLILESSNLGRGSFYYDNDTRRHFEINTVSVTKWHASSEGNHELPISDHCHFYAFESYTIRWMYQVCITVRELTGKISSRSTVGRDRCAYFNWQGCEASASERGTSTLQMVDLDKEKGSQMIIEQFQEFPAFVRLFKTMFIHKSRVDDSSHNAWRMYLVYGCGEDETVVYEVPCLMTQLRSRACMILVNGRSGQLLLWRGAKTSREQHAQALAVGSQLKVDKPRQLFSADRVELRETFEGDESAEFKNIFEGSFKRQSYGSLAERPEKFDFTPRMYEMTSKNGAFEAIESVPALRQREHPTAFPFVQQDLYAARQPTLFMIDNGYALYLWQGWWPAAEEDVDDVDGSKNENRAGENRWHLERCVAMQAAIDYWKAKYAVDDKYRKEAFIITAGFEPVEFQTIFPEWIVHEDVVELNEEVRRKFN